MPPKRRAAAASAVKAQQTLHSFSSVGKNIPKPGKLAGKAGAVAEITKKGATKDTSTPSPKFEVRQDGDEDVVVRREEPAKVDLTPPVELVESSPDKIEQEKKQDKVKEGKFISAEVSPTKVKPAKLQLEKTAGPVKKSKTGKSKPTLSTASLTTEGHAQESLKKSSLNIPNADQPNGDNVGHEGPTEVDLPPLLESVEPSPAETRKDDKPEPAEDSPVRAKITRSQLANTASSAKKLNKKSKSTPSATNAATQSGSKRKRTLLDDYVASPAKKRELRSLERLDLPTPPATSSPAPIDDDLPSSEPTRKQEIKPPGSLDPPTLPVTSSPAPFDDLPAPTQPVELPSDLILLQSLHTSLLTALLLHRAHNSNSIQPPVFSAIKLHIERLCRRNITLEDVRRIVYLSHYSPGVRNSEEHFDTEGGLKLINYGSNKICISFVEKTRARKLINTDILKKDFLSRTHSFFHAWNKAQAALPTPPSSFPEPSHKDEGDESKSDVKENGIYSKGDEVKSKTDDDEINPKLKEDEEEDAVLAPLTIALVVPLAKIHAHHRAKTISKVLNSKGQQRLDDMLKRSKPALLSSPIKAKTAGPPTVRGDSLLSRIRAKAEAAALEAAKAPSKEEQEREAARQRIPDVEPILKGLASRGSNMTMKSVVEGIRESIKNPISSEQAETAVRLIAETGGTGGWVKVRQAGKIVGVIFGKRDNGGFV